MTLTFYVGKLTLKFSHVRRDKGAGAAFAESLRLPAEAELSGLCPPLTLTFYAGKLTLKFFCERRDKGAGAAFAESLRLPASRLKP